MNRLYYGDNLSIMEKMGKHGVDLIYLDPPFKSQQNYNLIYTTLTGKPVPEQAEAFCDTWEMDAEKDRIARNMPVLMKDFGVEPYYVDFWRLWMQALRHTQPHLLAYLIYMVQRLLHMKIILKPTGSIYLHCDPTASHYIKVMMDGIFGHRNFRSEIIWQRTTNTGSSKARARQFSTDHDTILFYTNHPTLYTFNPQYRPYTPEYIKRYYTNDDNDGKGPYQIQALKTVSEERLASLEGEGRIVPGKGRYRRFKDYLQDKPGVAMNDIWTDIEPVNPAARDKLGYPTQKPVPLLDRIIRASSKKGDVVFDPFCGCGTTIYAAHEAERRWIGCDVAILAVRLIQEQLRERYRLVEGKHFTVDGIPNSVDAAATLFKHDPFQFEHWAVERVGGFPTKKTGDKGIDGRIYFETQKELGVMVLSVKGGGIRPTDIRDLRGVLADEPGVFLAGFISLQEPSKAMRTAADDAGTWEYRGVEYPRVQMLTVREILEEKRAFVMPTKIGTKNTTGQLALPV